jgi:hemerythrin-like domain-containing protein
MKRSAALAPLSRDHHHALNAALRLRRASADDLEAAADAFRAFFEGHGRRHFEVEEDLLLPALPGDGEWESAAARVRADHADLRAEAAALADPATADRLALAHRLGDRLDRHVRFEERELFGMLEARLPDYELARLGAAVEAAERG